MVVTLAVNLARFVLPSVIHKESVTVRAKLA
jgi:hypothetical protein